MTVYAEFTAEEQRLLTQSIAAAATVVSVASPGSRADLVSEGFAPAEFVLDSLRTHVDNPLVSSVIVAIKDRIAADQPFPDYTHVATAEDAGARARHPGGGRRAARLARNGGGGGPLQVVAARRR